MQHDTCSLPPCSHRGCYVVASACTQVRLLKDGRLMPAAANDGQRAGHTPTSNTAVDHTGPLPLTVNAVNARSQTSPPRWQVMSQSQTQTNEPQEPGHVPARHAVKQAHTLCIRDGASRAARPQLYPLPAVARPYVYSPCSPSHQQVIFAPAPSSSLARPELPPPRKAAHCPPPPPRLARRPP